jgi:hypothetical protein
MIGQLLSSLLEIQQLNGVVDTKLQLSDKSDGRSAFPARYALLDSHTVREAGRDAQVRRSKPSAVLESQAGEPSRPMVMRQFRLKETSQLLQMNDTTALSKYLAETGESIALV